MIGKGELRKKLIKPNIEKTDEAEQKKTRKAATRHIPRMAAFVILSTRHNQISDCPIAKFHINDNQKHASA